MGLIDMIAREGIHAGWFPNCIPSGGWPRRGSYQKTIGRLVRAQFRQA